MQTQQEPSLGSRLSLQGWQCKQKNHLKLNPK